MISPRLLPILLLAICLATGAGCAYSNTDSDELELNDKSLQVTPKAYGDNPASATGRHGAGSISSIPRNAYVYGYSGYVYNAAEYSLNGGVSQDGWTAEEIKAASFIYSSTVYFSFDSDALTASAKEVLKQKAARMKAFPQLHIIVAGHADERGTEEYNLNLGQRRAQAAFNYLTGLGVDPKQLSTVSYGKMRPVAAGSNESAWSLNRRAEFLVSKPE